MADATRAPVDRQRRIGGYVALALGVLDLVLGVVTGAAITLAVAVFLFVAGGVLLVSARTRERSDRRARLSRPGLRARIESVHPGLDDAPFLAACRREQPRHTPVWFMRQAGRALPEYRKLREGVPMLESCRRPDLTVEITMQPVRRMGTDAAIFFSDIVVPLAAVGIDLDIVAGTGPVIAEPVRDRAAVERIRPLEPDDVPDITESVGRLVEELGATPLIGFAGAPFTLASYLVEGGPSRNHARTKALMYGAARRLARAARPARRHRQRLPAGAGRRRCERGPAVRQLGRRAEPRGLPPLRAAALRAVLAERAGRAEDPLRGRHR